MEGFDLKVEPVNFAAWKKIRQVRDAVFLIEQGIPEDIEIDGMDPQCRHVLVYDPENRPIGTARMQADGKIGRMAVLAAWRGRGAGAHMVETLCRMAIDACLPEVYLHSQKSAVGFYKKLGFMTVGEEFFEAGIVHYKMVKKLSSPSPEFV